MTETATKELGKYEVLEKIGAGGMATVFLGVQRSIGREVAVKILRKSLADRNENFYKLFFREVELVARLQHPHILPVYDYGQYRGYAYIVMAYLRGGSLAQWIARGPMEIGTVMTITEQLADALDYAHSCGVIHRDFKPANVMLDEQHNTYLADFGLARATSGDAHRSGGALGGTPAYMAPDLQDISGITTSIDVYALGVTLYQMLTGHVPYPGDNPMAVLMAHLKQPVPDVLEERPDLPAAVQEVIATAMAKIPDQRYSTAGELYAALTTAVEGNTSCLLFSNMRGQVIYVNKHLLNLLNLPEGAARRIVSKPMHEVLGVDEMVAGHLISAVKDRGRLNINEVRLRTSGGAIKDVSLSATATFDDDGKFVGADFIFQPKTDSQIAIAAAAAAEEEALDTSENDRAQLYFGAQMQGLGDLLDRTAGPKLRSNLDRIVNETAERNGWPVHMDGDSLDLEHVAGETHIYHALLSKAAAYASSMLGDKLVEKQMRTVDDGMSADALALAGQLGLRDIFIDRRMTGALRPS